MMRNRVEIFYVKLSAQMIAIIITCKRRWGN